MSAGNVRVSEPTRWADLCRRFPAQWVVLVAIDWTDDDGTELRTAFVAGQAASRREALAVARPLTGVFELLGAFHTSSARIPPLPPIVHTTAPVADEHVAFAAVPASPARAFAA